MTIDNAYFRSLLRKQQTRRAQAERLAASGRPVRLISNAGRRALAQPDMSEPGLFRITWFDNRGPSGHCCFNSLVEAVLEGIKMGYKAEDAESVETA